MNKIARTLACAASALAVVSAWAQLGELAEGSDEAPETATEESSDEEEAEPSAEGEAPAAPAAKEPEGKAFHLLPLCRTVDGRGEVMAPGSSEWTEVEEGKFYPLGCSFRTVGADSRMSVMFGPESEVVLSGDSSFGSLPAKIGEKQIVGDFGRARFAHPHPQKYGFADDFQFVVRRPKYVNLCGSI